MSRTIYRILNTCIFLLIIYLVANYFSRLVNEVSITGIWQDLQTRKVSVVLGALFLTLCNYILFIGYDLLTARQLNLKLCSRHLCVISLITVIMTNNLGFGWLTAGIIRFRCFLRILVSASTITKYLVLISWVYVLGLFVLGTVIFLFFAGEIQLSIPLIKQNLSIFWLGFFFFLCLCVFAGLVIAKARYKLKSPLLLPVASPGIAAMQIVLSTLDWLLLSAVFLMLLPDSPATMFSYLPYFILAQMVAIISHLPGGVGAFDAVILIYLKPVFGIDAVLSTLILFRLIYFILPFFFGLLLFTGYECFWLVKKRKGPLSDHGCFPQSVKIGQIQ